MFSLPRCSVDSQRERKGERKKLRLTEHSADAHDGLEDGVGEAGSEPQGNAVGQTQPQGLVLGHEEKLGVGVDAVFLQSPGRPQQPALLLLPPQRVVGPITLDLCRGKTRNRCQCNVKHSQHRSASSAENKTENSLSQCRTCFSPQELNSGLETTGCVNSMDSALPPQLFGLLADKWLNSFKNRIYDAHFKRSTKKMHRQVLCRMFNYLDFRDCGATAVCLTSLNVIKISR